MSTYQASSLTIRGTVHHTPGLATVHKDGNTSAAVTIYTGELGGSFTVHADSVAVLRSLSEAFDNAADELQLLNLNVEMDAQVSA